MVKCSQCGIESEIEPAFHREVRWNLTRPKYYCPRCYEKTQVADFKKVLVYLLVLLLLSGAIFFLAPGSSIGWLVINIVLAIACMFPMVFIHELAHMLVGRLMGLRVFAVMIGFGRTVFKRQWGGIQWEFKSTPGSGVTVMGSPPRPGYRLRVFLATLAGPASHALVLGLILAILLVRLILRLDTLAASGLMMEGNAPQPLLAALGEALVNGIFWSNALMLGISLFPAKVHSVYGEVSTDGMRLFQLPFASEAELQDAYASYYAQEGILASQRKDYPAARAWVEKGVNLYPQNQLLLNTLGYVYTHLEEYGLARQIFFSLAQDSSNMRPELRMIVWNNVAYTDLMLDDTALLAEADCYSAEAYKNMPWIPFIAGTRGAVLVALGQIEAGIGLLQEALARAEDASSKASEAGHLAIAEARRGNREEAQRYLDLSRQLDPQGRMLERAEAELSGTLR